MSPTGANNHGASQHEVARPQPPKDNATEHYYTYTITNSHARRRALGSGRLDEVRKYLLQIPGVCFLHQPGGSEQGAREP